MAEKDINGTLYSSSHLPAKRAVVLWARITKVLGPALPSLVKAFASRDDEQAAAAASLEALNAIAADLDPLAFGDLIEEVVQTAEIQDSGRYRKVIFDQDFTGNLQEVLPVVGFVLQTQFGDLFTGLLASGSRKAA